VQFNSMVPFDVAEPRRGHADRLCTSIHGSQLTPLRHYDWLKSISTDFKLPDLGEHLSGLTLQLGYKSTANTPKRDREINNTTRLGDSIDTTKTLLLTISDGTEDAIAGNQ
jgi:hypothetical protein